MSWDQAVAILREQAQVLTEPEPQACPNDGEPYRFGPDGSPYCPFDGYRP